MKGMIHLYYGYGKGKTTAAMGLALRAAGRGRKVLIVQFLKNIPSGEVNELKELPNITLLRGQASNKFLPNMSAQEVDFTAEIQNRNFSAALEAVGRGECDMLVLDEALDAYQLNMLDRDMFEQLIRSKPDELELVITGHMPEDWLIDRADYVSEMVKRKHPYDKGITARAGIEY